MKWRQYRKKIPNLYVKKEKIHIFLGKIKFWKSQINQKFSKLTKKNSNNSTEMMEQILKIYAIIHLQTEFEKIIEQKNSKSLCN